MDRVLGTCSNCLLTPSAEKLLSRLEADLRASRGQDGSWESHPCPECGRTTVVQDHRERWSFGDTGWSFEPDEDEAGDLDPASAVRPSLDLAPEWLTLNEAAYLTDTPIENLAASVEAGHFEHVSLLGEDRLGVLVRADHLVDAATEEPRKSERDRRAARRRGRVRKQRSDGLGPITVLLVGALGLLFVAALWSTDIPSTSQDRDEGATTSTTPISPGSAEDTADEGARTANSTGDLSAPAPNLLMDPVRFVVGDDWISAAVLISNTGERWLPASEVTFLVLDASGASVGSGQGIVDLGPGETAVVVAEEIELAPETTVVDVRAELDAAPFRGPEGIEGALFVDDAAIRGSSVVGHVVNTGPARGSVRVQCAISGPAGALTAVASASVGSLGTNSTTSFRLPVSHWAGTLASVVCSAT